MKLTSKEQCPISVRDRLIEQFAGLDVGILDMKLALEIAEAKCFELNEKLEALQQSVSPSGNYVLGLDKFNEFLEENELLKEFDQQ